MIDNFLGIDTEGGGGGVEGPWTLWFLPYNAASSDDPFFSFFYKGQIKSPILHNTRRSVEHGTRALTALG